MRRLRRAAAFALVPLSAVPIVAVAPQIAPSFEQRIDELRGETAQTAPAPLRPGESGPPVPRDATKTKSTTP